MSKHRLVSIIIPAYNATPYLAQCVRSVCAQTYQNIEILIVDDCSTDNTAALCRELCAEDKRIKLIEQPINAGAGEARQTGMNHARGEYVAFADADDYVAPQWIETLVHTLETYRADIACCNGYYVCEDGTHSILHKKLKIEESLSAKEALLKMHKKKGIGYALWDKLFRKSILEKLRFKSGWYEDQAILPYIFQQAERVACTPQALYYYVQREGSVMHGAYNPQKEYFAFNLFCKEARLLKEQYGVQGLSTTVRRGIRFINKLCLLPESEENQQLINQVKQQMQADPECGGKCFLRIKLYLILHRLPTYKAGFKFYLQFFEKKKYENILRRNHLQPIR